jgi:hypothetical protein
MTDQEIQTWRKGLRTKGTHNHAIPDISLLSSQQLVELEAKIVAERENRKRGFIDEAGVIELRSAQWRKPRRRSAPPEAASIITIRERLTDARSRSPARLLLESNTFWCRYNSEVRERLSGVAAAEITARILGLIQYRASVGAPSRPITGTNDGDLAQQQ